MKNEKETLSVLWIFVTLNYLYCDLIGLMDASLLKQYLTGEVEGLVISESFLLYAGLLMEIPMAMILLSKFLPTKSNAWSNIIAGFIKSAVMILTLCIGHVTSYYWFFAIVEISTTVFIVLYSVQWLKKALA